MKIYGIILAGGKSSRMGHDKAELIWQGKTLLASRFEMMQETVQEPLGTDRVLVSGDRPGFPHVVDEYGGYGPLEGFRSTLKEIRRRELESEIGKVSVLLCPVDMPIVDKNYLLKLIEGLSQAEVVKYSGFELPALFTDIDKTLNILNEFDHAEHKDSKRSFRNIYSKFTVREIVPENLNTFTNVNTKEEWHETLSAANNSSASEN